MLADPPAQFIPFSGGLGLCRAAASSLHVTIWTPYVADRAAGRAVPVIVVGNLRPRGGPGGAEIAWTGHDSSNVGYGS
jgi:hypothetical protein